MGEKVVIELSEVTSRALRENLPAGISVERFIEIVIEAAIKLMVRVAGEETEEGVQAQFGIWISRMNEEFMLKMNDSDRLWDELCCCGSDHTVREGGSHINLVQLKKLAKWPYMASMNFLVPKSEEYPLANAVVCDRCLEEKKEIKYAVAGEPGNDGHAHYYRVPIDELEDPEFYWPDHHPDNE